MMPTADEPVFDPPQQFREQLQKRLSAELAQDSSDVAAVDGWPLATPTEVVEIAVLTPRPQRFRPTAGRVARILIAAAAITAVVFMGADLFEDDPGPGVLTEPTAPSPCLAFVTAAPPANRLLTGLTGVDLVQLETALEQLGQDALSDRAYSRDDIQLLRLASGAASEARADIAAGDDADVMRTMEALLTRLRSVEPLGLSTDGDEFVCASD